MGYSVEDLLKNEKLLQLRNDLKKINIKEVAKDLEIGELTLGDIINELSKPGRDPREDMPKQILRSDVLKFEDLKEDMILKGTVRNVTDFGAFVDIGVKHDGLVHISQLSKTLRSLFYLLFRRILKLFFHIKLSSCIRTIQSEQDP